MTFKGKWMVAILFVLFRLGNPIDGNAQIGTKGFDPLVVDTPWGQPVVPDLPAFLDIQVYRR